MLSTFLFASEADINGFKLKPWLLKLLSVGIVVLCFDIFFFVNTITKKAFLLSLKLSALLSVFSLIVGLLQNHFDIYASPLRPGRHASVFLNENYYGTAIEYLFLIALFLFFYEKKKSSKFFYGFVLLCNVLGLWLCQSRAAFIVVACASVIFLFIYGKRAVYIVAACAFAVFAIILIYNPSVLPRFDTSSEYLQFRFGIWKVAWESILDQPLLGKGYLSYAAVWNESSNISYFALHAHNLYIEILLNFGLIGFFSLGGYSVFTTLESAKNCIRSKDRLSLALVISTACAVLIHGMADTTLFWPQTGIFVVYILSTPRLYLSASTKGGTDSCESF
jgi:O-antigen ligase